jgi:hypothetical protein
MLRIYKEGVTPTLIVGRDFRGITDRVTYCNEIVSPFNPIEFPQALTWARNQYGNVIAAQVFANTQAGINNGENFAEESYRLIGRLHQFGSEPTLFDARDYESEAAIVSAETTARPYILIATKSVSSPFPQAVEMEQAIQHKYGKDYDVINVSEIHAPNPVDLLGLLDGAACLISVDTMHLWLARALRRPPLDHLQTCRRRPLHPPRRCRLARSRCGATQLRRA